VVESAARAHDRCENEWSECRYKERANSGSMGRILQARGHARHTTLCSQADLRLLAREWSEAGAQVNVLTGEDSQGRFSRSSLGRSDDSGVVLPMGGRGHSTAARGRHNLSIYSSDRLSSSETWQPMAVVLCECDNLGVQGMAGGP